MTHISVHWLYLADGGGGVHVISHHMQKTFIFLVSNVSLLSCSVDE